MKEHTRSERETEHEALARYLKTLDQQSENTRLGRKQNATGAWAELDSLANWGVICNQLIYVAIKIS